MKILPDRYTTLTRVCTNNYTFYNLWRKVHVFTFSFWISCRHTLLWQQQGLSWQWCHRQWLLRENCQQPVHFQHPSWMQEPVDGAQLTEVPSCVTDGTSRESHISLSWKDKNYEHQFRSIHLKVKAKKILIANIRNAFKSCTIFYTFSDLICPKREHLRSNIFHTISNLKGST